MQQSKRDAGGGFHLSFSSQEEARYSPGMAHMEERRDAVGSESEMRPDGNFENARAHKYGLVEGPLLQFRALLCWREAGKLANWMERAFHGVAQFAKTLRRDLAAVELAIETP